jgi:ethanolamine utilization cobalamin adenosyltransferase
VRVITEIELREQFKKEEFTSFCLPEGAKLTPAARQFLNDHRIKLISSPQTQAASLIPSQTPEGKKPEHFTHLWGSTLTPKTHPRIKLRGKLDSFQALLIAVIIEVNSQGYLELAQDLKELLNYVRQILAAEVKGEDLPPLTWRGYSDESIHKFSHNPQEQFGIGHLLPDPEQGKIMAALNCLRTKIREVELCAVETFYRGELVEREDIIKSLNRLSSLIYVLMLKFSSGGYKIGAS